MIWPLWDYPGTYCPTTASVMPNHPPRQVVWGACFIDWIWIRDLKVWRSQKHKIWNCYPDYSDQMSYKDLRWNAYNHSYHSILTVSQENLLALDGHRINLESGFKWIWKVCSWNNDIIWFGSLSLTMRYPTYSMELSEMHGLGSKQHMTIQRPCQASLSQTYAILVWARYSSLCFIKCVQKPFIDLSLSTRLIFRWVLCVKLVRTVAVNINLGWRDTGCGGIAIEYMCARKVSSEDEV